MTATQNFINVFDFNKIIQKPWQFILTEEKTISSWQLRNHSLPQTILLLIVSVIILTIIRKLFIIRNNLKEKSIVLEITPLSFSQKSAYATQKLFEVIHDARSGNGFVNWLLGRKVLFSFEIASKVNLGIKYFVRVSPNQAENMKRTIRAYLPSVKVQEVDDYIDSSNKNSQLYTKVIEFKLGKRFGFPLQKQDLLSEHDPIAYITGMMTQLKPGELISYQVVVSPTESKKVPTMMTLIYTQGDLLGYLNRPQYPYGLQTVAAIGNMLAKLINKLGENLQWAITELYHGSSTSSINRDAMTLYQQQLRLSKIKPMRQLSPFEQETIQSVREKIEQPLFKSSIRILVSVKSKRELNERIRGLQAALKPFAVPQYQSLQSKWNFPPVLIHKVRTAVFQNRLLSLVNNATESLVSVSEVADLYHIPAKLTQTENIIKSLSRELPAPVSYKSGEKLDVVFAENHYNGVITKIGLTREDRTRHGFSIGRTGAGKSTVLFHMGRCDMQKGRGLCVIDPHGDLSEDLRAVVPLSRIDDFIYFDPFDIKYPIRINLLELTPGLSEDDAELEKELVAEHVITIFRRLFSQDEQTNAHRIEYMLRSTIYTAFTVKDRTIFTLYKLLTNPEYRDEVVAQLEDEDLQDFWKHEFGLAGDFQVYKSISGVTAKIGRFLRSPMAKRILEHPKSSINFDKILDEGKILICNLSEGKLSEDTSHLLGTTIITKIHQAAQKRARLDKEQRNLFCLYVDEFQNYATKSFNKLLTGGRKFGLSIMLAEQTTAQQDDPKITEVVIANTANIMCFQTASPTDEDLMLRQFAPYIERGDIANLPRYHFYMKRSSLIPEEPFSAVTLPIHIKKDPGKIQLLIDASRKNYAIEYKRPEKKTQEKNDTKKQKKSKKKTGKMDLDTL